MFKGKTDSSKVGCCLLPFDTIRTGTEYRVHTNECTDTSPSSCCCCTGPARELRATCRRWGQTLIFSMPRYGSMEFCEVLTMAGRARRVSSHIFFMKKGRAGGRAFPCFVFCVGARARLVWVISMTRTLCNHQ